MPDPVSTAGEPRVPREARRPPAWTYGQAASAAVFLGILLFQVGMPITRLWAPRPTQWGWQMFAASPHLSGVAVLHGDGTVTKVRQQDYVISGRADLPLRTLLPAHLCRVVPGAAAVRFVAYPDTSTRTLPCAR